MKSKRHTRKNRNPCNYSEIEMKSTAPSIFHTNVQKLQRLINCVIRSDEILGYYLHLVNSHPKYSTAPLLEIYRKLDPDDPHYIGPPNGFMHGLYYDLTHWYYVYHGHAIDSYSQEHQIQDSDNFCSTFALMYLLETHHLRPHYPLRKKAYYHNIRLACQFWIYELHKHPDLKQLFEKRIQTVRKETHIDSLNEAIKLLHWGKHHAEEFYKSHI
jgi:hypothetical protein